MLLGHWLSIHPEPVQNMEMEASGWFMLTSAMAIVSTNTLDTITQWWPPRKTEKGNQAGRSHYG